MPAKTPPAASHNANQALAAAEKVTHAADAALVEVRERLIPTAEQKLSRLESEAVELLVDAIHSNADGITKSDLSSVKAQIEEASGDVHWAHLQLQAAEIAHSRAADSAAAAQRRVTAEKYVAESLQFNDPASRENQLLSDLANVVRELIPLINARQGYHDTLTRDVQSWPTDEREDLYRTVSDQHRKAHGDNAFRQITTHGQRGLGSWVVNIPLIELAGAIETGIAVAEADAKSRAKEADGLHQPAQSAENL